MKSRLFIALMVASTFLHAGTTTKWAKIYASDNQWWKCDEDPSKGCTGGALESLGLTRNELNYVEAILNNAPWYPAAASKQDVIKYFGTTPAQDIDAFKKLHFDRGAQGLCQGCSLSVYMYGGFLSKMYWYVPGKFMLARHNPRDQR